MRIKGGGLGKGNQGKIIAAFGFAALCLCLKFSFLAAVLAGLGWWLGNKASLGEIEGAIGGFKGNWREEGKSWGWKQGLQRGVFTGACLAVFTWNPAFILAGALFPLCAWIGISFEQLRAGKVQVSWYLFEILWGGCLGVAFLIT